MSAVSIQGRLPLGAGDYVSLARDERHNIFLVNNESYWKENGYSLKEAVYYADYYSKMDFSDVYVSNHSFNSYKNKRNASNVSELRGLFVDFDYYNTQYKDLSVPDFAHLVLSQKKWLSVPTLIVSSGRGCYMIWLFKKPLAINKKTERYGFMTQWQTQQDFLINELLEFGADKACSDPARVFRLPETLNSRNNAKAEAWETGKYYEFKELKASANKLYRERNPRTKADLLPPKSNTKKAGFKTVSNLYNFHSLAHARMQDLQKLSHLRGGLKDHRRMAIFVYAVVAAHFCRTEDQLKAEIQNFIDDCICGPGNYMKKVNIKAVIKRFNESLNCALYSEDNTRYKMKNTTIIGYLNITEREQKELKTIIGKDEKYRRKVKSRRGSGIVERSQYVIDQKAGAEARKAKARTMQSKGKSTAEIADDLGVSKRSVMNYLKQ